MFKWIFNSGSVAVHLLWGVCVVQNHILAEQSEFITFLLTELIYSLLLLLKVWCSKRIWPPKKLNVYITCLYHFYTVVV